MVVIILVMVLASQQNVEEDNDETCAYSRYHSDHGSGSQVPIHTSPCLLVRRVSIDADTVGFCQLRRLSAMMSNL